MSDEHSLPKKQCRLCNITYPITEYYYRVSTEKYDTACKSCVNKQKKLNREKEANKQKVRLKHYLSTYNITIEDYIAILNSQNNHCAICKCSTSNTKKTEHFFIDHDHNTNQIRGLLCHKCNSGIGMFSDNTDLLKSAIDYIDKSKEYMVNGIKLKRK